MRHIHALDPVRTASLDTTGLRENYLVSSLFVPGAVNLVHWEVDRTVAGGAIPLAAPLTLTTPKELAASFFCERRELGVLNIGADGSVSVDGQSFPLRNGDCLYVARGSREVTFTSADAAKPAKFFLLSYPAHTAYPTRLIRKEDARRVSLGTKAEANERVIHQFIRPEVCDSCQLVLGYTTLASGSVWNTWKPHTHGRRSEVYLYFDIPENECVMHFLGAPSETRHLVVRDAELALSPSWSIHSGCGTGAYRFIWGMGGENQVFTDMDPVSMAVLR
jgi:4-deoxy-L-threo-5-hexosulose-uronate ketol-isomerase